MNISQYKLAIGICRKAGLPLMAWGPGGVGKTTGFKQYAEDNNLNNIILQGTLLQPVDLLGLPDRQGNKTVWSRPEILPEEGGGIILIDELPDSALSMQKAYYQLILDHKVQSHIIPESWWIMGAGNRAIDLGFSSPMPAPLITRFSHIGVCCDCPDFTNETPKTAEIDIDDFISYAISNFHEYVVAFLKFRPEFIYSHQATPRTWEYVSKIISNTEINFVSTLLIQGTVGVQIGREFITFIKLISKIPSIDLIIKDPTNGIIPEEPSILYAVITALIKRTNINNATNIIKYITRIRKEYQFFYFNLIKKELPEIITNELYIRWANDNSNYLI